MEGVLAEAVWAFLLALDELSELIPFDASRRRVDLLLTLGWRTMWRSGRLRSFGRLWRGLAAGAFDG